MRVVSSRRRQRAEDPLVNWRYAYLRWAGLDHDAAAVPAHDLRWDLNALLELVGLGCPSALALRILAPIDTEGVPPA